jgi:transposase-like protein
VLAVWAVLVVLSLGLVGTLLGSGLTSDSKLTNHPASGAAQDLIDARCRSRGRSFPQAALEDEVTEFVGRVRYERAADPVSHRDGYEPRRVVTTAGPVELERSRLRNAEKLG